MKRLLSAGRAKWQLVVLALSVLLAIGDRLSFGLWGIHAGAQVARIISVPAGAGVVLIVSSDLLRAVRNSSLPGNQLGRQLARFSVRGLTDLAALLAGRKRPALRAEWRAHLAGWSGHDSADWEKVRQALGFVASAIRCRCSDAADAAWVPVDAVLKSRILSNLFVFIPAAMAAYIVLRHDGTLGVVTAAESIIAIGGMMHGLIRVARWWRNVKPPEPKARRAEE